MVNEKVERLIELVRGHEFLYDVNHPQYKNYVLKTSIWDSIGKELNESGDAVRSKWKTIRDGYTKFKKQLKRTKGKKYVSYTWAPYLAFMDSCNGIRQSASTVSNEDTQSLEVLVSPELSVTTQDAASPSTHSSRKRSTENRDDEFNGRHYKKKKRYDAIDNLFLSYAHTFKRFPLREQAIVKLELAKLFSSTELQLLDSNSYDTNNHYASSDSPASSND